jgi:Ca2+/Na+ antiporter
MNPEVFNNLIETLIHADKSQNRKLRLAYYLLFFVGFCFLFVFSLNTTLTDISQIILANVFVVALVIVALYLRGKYVNKNRTDYSLPLLNVLKKTERRYRFWSSEWIFIVILIMLSNLTVSVLFRLIPLSDQLTPAGLTILAQSIYLPLLGLAFLLEWISWKKLRKPVGEKTVEMIKELES